MWGLTVVKLSSHDTVVTEIGEGCVTKGMICEVFRHLFSSLIKQ